MLQNPNFRGLRPGLRWGNLQLTDGEGGSCPRSRPFGPRFYGSRGVTHYRVSNPILMTDFKCRPRPPIYEVRIFPVSENGENGLSDEGADGGNAPPEFLG